MFGLRRFGRMSLTAPHLSGEIHPSRASAAAGTLRELFSSNPGVDVREPAQSAKQA
jgi:hypothetical protein